MMSNTTKHKIERKFMAGLIELKDVPENIRKGWNRRNFDKGEFRALRAKKKELKFKEYESN